MHVIKTELVVGTVGDIGLVRLALVVVVHGAQHHTDAEAEKIINLPHPFGIALGEVIIDGHDVHALAADGVEVGRQGCDQGLTFTGTHFGDLVIMQNHAADQLHVIMTHAQRAYRRLSTNRKCFIEQLFQGFAVGKTLAEFVGFLL